MTEILREPTSSDMAAREFGEGTMIPLSTPRRRIVKSPRDRFNIQIAAKEVEAIKKSLPFAINALRAEKEEMARMWETRWKRRGYADDKKDPQPKVDWERYSNLKNFKVVGEGETHDRDLTKVNKFPIFIKWIKYKFEEFPESYTVMESAEESVERALAKFKGESLEIIRKPQENANKVSDRKGK